MRAASDSIDDDEYVGISINLASRLVKYCEQLSFIAAASLDISEATKKKYFWVDLEAKRLGDFRNEPVYVDAVEYDELPPDISEEYFAVP
jgi:hypothetical protein